MDFNYLYHRRQVSLMRADRAACAPSRAAHEGLALLYSGAIDRKRDAWLSEPGETGPGAFREAVAEA